MLKKKKDNTPENKTQESAPAPKKKSSFKIVGLILVVLLLLGGLGAGGVYYLMMKKAPIMKSALQPEILVFLEEKLPELNDGFAKLDEEMVLSENEMNRIAKIGEAFPSEKKISDTEYKVWDSNMKALQKAQADFEKEIQIFYVSYLVNPEAGLAQMNEKRDALKQNLETAVSGSKPLTDKLRELEAKKPFVQRMKDKLIKGKP